MNKNKIIVTGGCGFIGSNLVNKLCKDENNKVIVIDNLSTGKKENFNDLAEYIYEDINFALTNKKHEKILKDASTIFHLAALARIQPSFDDPQDTFVNNANGTIAVCEYARKNNIKVVYAGSSSFYAGPHLNPYSFTKWIGEEICCLYNKVYNLDVNIARFFNVYGPNHLKTGPYATVLGIFEEQWVSKKPLTVTGDGEQRRDFTHVFDICSGLISMSLIKGESEIYNLGTSKNYSINEVASMFNGSEITYIAARPGEARETLADIQFSKEKLNYKPHQELKEYVDSFLSENKLMKQKEK